MEPESSKEGGKHNPPDAWVWSSEPTHEAIVPRERFDAAIKVAAGRQGSRSEPGANLEHTETARSYLLRSYVFCDLCGMRMFGKTRSGLAYYACYPRLNHGPGAEREYPDHPRSVYVREDPILQGILGFFGERVFGPKRKELLAADLKHVDGEPGRDRARKMTALRRSLEDLELRAARQIRSLEMDDDARGPMFRKVREGSTRSTRSDAAKRRNSVGLRRKSWRTIQAVPNFWTFCLRGVPISPQRPRR